MDFRQKAEITLRSYNLNTNEVNYGAGFFQLDKIDSESSWIYLYSGFS